MSPPKKSKKNAGSGDAKLDDVGEELDATGDAGDSDADDSDRSRKGRSALKADSNQAGPGRIAFAPLWKKAMIGSLVLVAIALVSLLARGLNLGIEFEGGASWELRSGEVNTDDLREALAPFGLDDARIQEVGNDSWRVRAEEGKASGEEVKAALGAVAGIPASDVTFNTVGASWGEEVTGSARTALIVFFIVIFIYITIRLEWKFAIGALVAVAHDILITVGIYALFQLEVTSATVIAFLTILGYSLYDTLVVFDKIRENERRLGGSNRFTYSGLVSHSLNQVLMRSINTTITSVLPVLMVLIIGRFVLGAVTLQEFAIALLVGLIVGTYSSLFVATPIVAWLKEREAQNVERRLRAGGSDEELDIEAELAATDRSRAVRAAARGDSTRRIGGLAGERGNRSGTGSKAKSAGVTKSKSKDSAKSGDTDSKATAKSKDSKSSGTKPTSKSGKNPKSLTAEKRQIDSSSEIKARPRKRKKK